MRVTIFIFSIVLFFSCSPDRNFPPLSTPRALTPFTVTVISRASTVAVIEWSQSMNFYNSDSVKYDVILQGTTLKSGIVKRTDTIVGLIADSQYVGSILAHTSTGDTASAPFILNRLKGYIYYKPFNGNPFICTDPFNNNQTVWYSYAMGPDRLAIPIIQHDTIFVNSSSQGVTAFNAKTGSEYWHQPLSAPLFGRTHPLYFNGKIFVTKNTAAYALNCSNGQILWTYNNEVSDDINPVIGNNSLFLCELSESSNVWKIISLNIDNGSKNWEFILHDQIGRSPVVYEDLLIFGDFAGKVTALNQRTGTIAWSRDFSRAYDNFGAEHMSPVTYNDLVIVQSGNTGLYALKGRTGETVWNYDHREFYSYNPAIGGGLLFFRANKKVKALNAATGTLVWENDYSSSAGGDPLYANNKIYLTGYFYSPVLDALTGDIIPGLGGPHADLDFPFVIVENGVAYYSSESGMVQ